MATKKKMQNIHIVIDAKYQNVLLEWSDRANGISHGQLLGCLIKFYENGRFNNKELEVKPPISETTSHVHVDNKIKKMIDKYCKKEKSINGKFVSRGRFVGFLLNQLLNGVVDENDLHLRIRDDWYGI